MARGKQLEAYAFCIYIGTNTFKCVDAFLFEELQLLLNCQLLVKLRFALLLLLLAEVAFVGEKFSNSMPDDVGFVVSWCLSVGFCLFFFFNTRYKIWKISENAVQTTKVQSISNSGKFEILFFLFIFCHWNFSFVPCLPPCSYRPQLSYPTLLFLCVQQLTVSNCKYFL